MPVFFLGLLSTPMPYLLLAAFYFAGFAMGVFNNSNGEETIETVEAVNIQVEQVSDQIAETSYYFQSYSWTSHFELSILNSDDISIPLIVWPEKQTFPDWSGILQDSRYIAFHFSRPPPILG